MTVSDQAIKAAILVEGPSDAVAVETLALRRGRDLEREGVAVVAMGGATTIGRHLRLLGPSGRDLRLAGLCDVGEEDIVRRGLAGAGIDPGTGRPGLEALGFHVCVVDLEDELIRCLGPETVTSIVLEPDTPGNFRTYQSQPAQRHRTLDEQHRGFVTNWKTIYAGVFVEALDLDHVPDPLDAVLAHV